MLSREGNTTEENDLETLTEIHNQRKIKGRKHQETSNSYCSQQENCHQQCKPRTRHLERNKYQITLEFLSCQETPWKTIVYNILCNTEGRRSTSCKKLSKYKLKKAKQCRSNTI